MQILLDNNYEYINILDKVCLLRMIFITDLAYSSEEQDFIGLCFLQEGLGNHMVVSEHKYGNFMVMT